MIDLNFDEDVTTTKTETEGINRRRGLKVAGIVSYGGAESKTKNQTVSRVKYTQKLELSKKNKY